MTGSQLFLYKYNSMALVEDGNKHIRANFGPEFESSLLAHDEIVDVYGSKVDTQSDCTEEPPPLDSLDMSGRLNDSLGSSGKSVQSVKLPRSALREISDPRGIIQKMEEEHAKYGVHHQKPLEQIGLTSEQNSDFVNNDSIVDSNMGKGKGHQDDRSKVAVEVTNGNHGGNSLRSEAKSALQKSSTSAKKFVPASMVSFSSDRESKAVISEDQAQLTAAAVSAAMSAAIPYFKGQADLEGQMKLLLDKVTRLERQEPIRERSLDVGFDKDHAAAKVERHLAELTEKRLQLLEKVLDKERKMGIRPRHEIESDSQISTARSFHRANFIEEEFSRPKSVHYTKVATAPRNALLSKANTSSSRSKSKRSSSKQTSFNDTSLFPRNEVPKPTDPSSELLKEILLGHNDSSLHTLDNSGTENRMNFQQNVARSATSYEAEARILHELALLKDELMSLKVREEPVNHPQTRIDVKTPRSMVGTENGDYMNSSTSSLNEEQIRLLKKRKSELLSQYFQEYSNPSPRVERFKLSDISNTSFDNLHKEPEQVLNEARNFRKRSELERQIQGRNMAQYKVHNRIDHICDGISDGYYQLRKNVDKEIGKIQSEVEKELQAAELQAQEVEKQRQEANSIPKNKFGKPISNVRGLKATTVERKAGPSGNVANQVKKPTASVRPFGQRNDMASKVRSKLAGEDEHTVQEVSPTQLAYQQLILQRQEEYRKKIERVQKLPAGSTVQNAGLLYNKNFYPVKGKVLAPAPETKEVATETKFQQNQEIQTETPRDAKVVETHSGKRVDMQHVVSSNKKDKFVIETLPCVEIESQLEQNESVEIVEKEDVKKHKKEPPANESRADYSDVIIVPGYGNEFNPRSSRNQNVTFVNPNRTYAQFQACLEDEILSHVLRNVVGEATVPGHLNREDDSMSDESSVSPENEMLLQIFIDAGIEIDKHLLKRLGEEEVMRLILSILEEQKRDQFADKLTPVRAHVNRVPTPTRTADDYTPVESEASQASIESEEPRVDLVDRGISPIEFAPAEESSYTEDVTEYSARVSIQPSREPKSLVATPEKTPPRSPESSIVESVKSVAKEPPPSPEKVVPSKMPEPTISTVFDDADMVDAGIQYESQPSFREAQTSPIHFAPAKPQRVSCFVMKYNGICRMNQLLKFSMPILRFY